MTPYLIAAMILAALAVGFLIAKFFASAPTPEVLLDAESEAWKKAEELLDFAADSSGDLKTIASLQTKIAQRNQRTAAFKAKVASLPGA